MLRKSLLYLSNQQQIFNFVRQNGLAKSFASRFVAGETLDGALDAVADLNGRGLTASLDLLGESVSNEREARDAGRQYLQILDRIHERTLDANVSVKLTAMGMDVSEDLCVAIMQDILDRARDYRTFVRLDMESSAYTDRTLRIFEDRLYPNYSEHVGSCSRARSAAPRPTRATPTRSAPACASARARTSSRRRSPTRTRPTWTRTTCGA
jgi:proline dehydrogenase